jgi:hypothetical protein
VESLRRELELRDQTVLIIGGSAGLRTLDATFKEARQAYDIDGGQQLIAP